ncbi:MAG: hypothetical protein ACOYEB_07390 [Enterococcus lemanii]|jgi:hypothetical protein
MKEINYSDLMEITIRSQKELDAIPLDFKGRIYVKCSRGDLLQIMHNYHFPVTVCENSSVMAWKNSIVEAWDNSYVEAYEDVQVIAYGNSIVEVNENVSVEAYENSSIIAYGNAIVEAYENSSVVAWENAIIIAYENSSVIAYGHVFVRAYENSSVVARGGSSVDANKNSVIVAYENTFIRAFENASVEAWDNSVVEANDNSSVKAYGNVQVINFLYKKAKIQTFGNARIVYNPETIYEFMDFHNIKYNKKTAKFYKAVHCNHGVYFSNYNPAFVYVIGKVLREECNPNVKENCSRGIHVSTLSWALGYGEDWKDLAILELEVDIDKIVLPKNSDGKIRTSEAKVLREVPLEECGLYGKILAKTKGRI